MASAGEMEITADGGTIHLRLVLSPDARLAEAAAQTEREVCEVCGARIIQRVWDRGHARIARSSRG